MTKADAPREPAGPTIEQFHAFQGMFDYFNRVLFGGKLAPCLLNFSRKAHCAGFFAPGRWQRSAGDAGGVHEISINPSTLKTQPPLEVVSTLVHEMAHQWQYDHGSPSRRGYHDKQWAEKMEAIGLMPSSTGKPGGRKTGQRMNDYVIKGGRLERAFDKLDKALLLPFVCEEPPERSAAGPDGQPRRKDPSKTKYSCPGCNAHVWGKPDLEIACLVCDMAFEQESI